MNKIVTKQSHLKIDSDIKSVVNDYLQEYNNNNTEDSSVQEDVSHWFCVQIQLERDRWLEKIKVALQEIEVQRRSGLNSQKLIQETLQHLHSLLQCFDIPEEVLVDIPENDPKIALPKYIEILMDICQMSMEERFQCQKILGIEQNGLNLATVLKQTLEDLVQETQHPTLEIENQNLYEELNNLKNMLYHKQKDIESLQKQLTAINDVIEEQKLDEKAKVQKAEEPKSKQSEPKVKFADEHQKLPASNVSTEENIAKQRILTNLTVAPFEIIPSVRKLDTRDSRTERPYSEKSVASYSSRVSTIETQTQTMREKSYIQISEEKLRALKIQAKKLETSLHDAISSMDKFNKKCHIGDNTISNVSTAINLTNVLTRNSRRGAYNARRLIEDLKVASWKKVPFEVQGSQSNLPIAKPKRCLSEGRRPDVNPEVQIDNQAKVQGHISERSTKRRGPVAKCLRCQKLFRKIDNHKLACCYHPKSKERFEKYNNSGQLLRVMYVWQCCRQDVDSDGCSFGQHV